MNIIEKSWYQRFGVSWLLLPLSGLFFCIAWLRRRLYARKLPQPISPPVIVVGNISVGGTGKTPFVLFVVEFLRDRGLSVGVISRGYGGQKQENPLLVEPQTQALVCGDEPKLIANRTGVPVVVCPNRNASIDYLKTHHQVDVIVSDDGMQHYKMPRTVEVCIVDSQRLFGNAFVLPAGPLREPKSRLNDVDLIVYNGGTETHHYQLECAGLYRVTDNTKISASIETAYLVSAIGNPERFEKSVKSMGIEVEGHVIHSDHHNFTADDFVRCGSGPIIMTEKDAVKCNQFAKDNWYYLRVNTVLNDNTIAKFEHILKNKEVLNGL